MLLEKVESMGEAMGDLKKKIAPGIVVLFVVAWLSTGFEWIGTSSTGIVTLRGKYVRDMGSGPNFKLPWPIEKVTEVETKISQELLLTSEELKEESSDKHDLEMLTGDQGKIGFEMAIQYRISNPSEWLWSTEDPLKSLRYHAIAIARYIIGKHSFRESYNEKRAEVAQLIKEELQKACDKLNENGAMLGVHIENALLQQLSPPEQVKGNFDELINAGNERAGLIAKAEGQVSAILNEANGEADKITNRAIAETTMAQNEASAEVAVFLAMLQEYQQNGEITKNEFEKKIREQCMDGVRRTIDKRSSTLFRNQ